MEMEGRRDIEGREGPYRVGDTTGGYRRKSV